MSDPPSLPLSPPMPPLAAAPPESAAERLQHQQERIRQELLRLRAELNAPEARELRRGLRQGGWRELAEGVTGVLEAVEGALRAVQAVQGLLRVPPGTADGAYPNLPSGLPLHLRRFLDERRESGRLEWTLGEDPLRGWVLRWTQYTESGEIRGSGRLYERPHAWLTD